MKAVVALLFLTFIGGGVWYYSFYPPTVLKRETQAALTHLGQTVATKDRAKIGEAFHALLVDDAKIRLEVSFFAIANNRPAVVEDFPDKASFIRFIDNILYSLSDYDYMANLETFALAEDRQSAAVTFSSKQWGDGNSYFGGASVEMRWSSDAACEGEVSFASGGPQLAKASCKMQLRSVPKPGQMEKFRNMESLQDLLKKQ